MVHLCREYALPRNDLTSRARGWIRKNTKIGPVLKTFTVVIMKIVTVLKFRSDICFKTGPPLGFEL